jgi:Bacterial hydrolase
MHKEIKECCPEFNPEKWDKKTFNWKNKHFIKESIPLFFHIPFPPMIGKKIMKMWRMAEESKKAPPKKENVLVLFMDPHPFKSELFLTVTEPVPNADNVEISGTFLSKVFDGPYNAIPKFFKEMDEYLAGKREKALKYYVHYAYCPKCAKENGHNYMIIFAEV